MTRKFVLISLFSFCVFFHGHSFNILNANETKGYEIQAQEYLKASVDKMISIIQDPKLSSSRQVQKQQLYEKAMEFFDFKTFSMLSLGKKYQSFSEQQKDEFVVCFSRLISNTYVSRLEGQNIDNITIEYVENNPLTPKKDIFRTDITTKIINGETTIPVVYRMIKRKDIEWKIYDVKIEGVSMAANYRDQFRQHLSDTPEEIIKDIREKLEK